MLPNVQLNVILVVAVWTVCVSSGLYAQTSGSKTDSPSRPAPLAIKTWAVLGDDAVVRSGLTDGLLAELSATDMKLVEREQLQQVANEQNMRLLMGNLSQESKRLGRMLNADALIIVHHVGKPVFFPGGVNNTPPQKIRLILCECSQGLRLGELTFESGPVDQRAKLMAEYVADRREHFAKGVQMIVGLSPLACWNIEHDFDHLQQRYFDIVAGRLMTVPGLALLELSEAQVVSKEFGAGERASKRLIPVMLEWEYRVDARQDPARVQVKARLVGSRVETMDSPDLPLDKAPAWLGDELVDRILKSNRGQPLELIDQQAILADRADYLMRLGDFAGAVQCREAYLLADPNNVDQRKLAIDHLLVLGNPPTIHPAPMESSFRKMIAEAVFRAATQSAISMDHLTYLIENRLIDQSTAIVLLQRMNNESRMLTGTRAHLLQILSQETKAIAGLNNLMSCNRRFVLQTAAKVLDLPEPQPLAPENRQQQLAAWHSYVGGLVVDDIAGHGGAIESFRYLERVVQDVVPETIPTSWEIYGAMSNYRKSFSPFRIQNRDLTVETVEIKIDEEAMKRWLANLTQSSHAHLRWYAQTLTILDKLKGNSGTLPDELRLEMERITSEITQRPYSQVRASNGTQLDAVLGILTPILARYSPKPDSPPQTPATTALNLTPSALPGEVIAGQISVEPVQLNLQQSDKTVALETILGFIPTKRKVDFLVFRDQVGALRDAHTYDPIHQNRIVSSAVWDGQHLWVAETDTGIFQYSLDGRLVRIITHKDGLQPHNHDLQLIVIKPNQLMVYGAVKPIDRTWMALLSIVDDQPKLKIMHEARRPYRQTPNPANPRVGMPNDDPTMVTQFRWSGVFHSETRQVCFIGRQAAPLAIDIMTGKVIAARLEPSPCNNTSGTMIAAGGYLYKAYSTGVAQYELPNGSLQPKLKRLVLNSMPDKTNPAWVEEHPMLVEHDGWIYKTGKVWYRFRPNGESVERLKSPTHIPPHRYSTTSASDHFGIVGFEQNSAPFYKIKTP